LNFTDTDLSAGNVAFNFGDLLAGILLSETTTATTPSTATTTMEGVNFEDLTCPLLEGEEEAEEDNPSGFAGSLEDLLAATEMDDAGAARAGVDRGDFVAAVIIPPGFSNGLLPRFDFLENNDKGGVNSEIAG